MENQGVGVASVVNMVLKFLKIKKISMIPNFSLMGHHNASNWCHFIFAL